MTTITLPRATVEQALKALEKADKISGYANNKKVITALRAALAQEQANPPGCDHCNHPLYAATRCRVCGRVTEQAEPVEPVAHRVVAGALFDFMGWLTSRRERLMLSSIDDAAPAADAIKDFAEMRGLSLDDAKVQDWNTAPPQRKPLTEEEIDALYDEHATHQEEGPAMSGWFDFARAVERAHGITGDESC